MKSLTCDVLEDLRVQTEYILANTGISGLSAMDFWRQGIQELYLLGYSSDRVITLLKQFERRMKSDLDRN